MFGHAVAALGDLNDDGVSDLAVGAIGIYSPNNPNNPDNPGNPGNPDNLQVTTLAGLIMVRSLSCI